MFTWPLTHYGFSQQVNEHWLKFIYPLPPMGLSHILEALFTPKRLLFGAQGGSLGYCDLKGLHRRSAFCQISGPRAPGPVLQCTHRLRVMSAQPPLHRKTQGEGGMAVSWTSNSTWKQQFGKSWMNQNQLHFSQKAYLNFTHTRTRFKDHSSLSGGGGLGHMCWVWEASVLFQSTTCTHSCSFSFAGHQPS